jgi:hypothetical protein
MEDIQHELKIEAEERYPNDTNRQEQYILTIIRKLEEQEKRKKGR